MNKYNILYIKYYQLEIILFIIKIYYLLKIKKLFKK